ncbi:MAG: GspE/PulE family protein [Bacilli bacterium]
MKEFDFEKIPIVEIANEILLDGVRKGASDIHFDPSKDCLKIRMRVDGILYDYSTVPGNYKKNIVSRIKMLASMNIMETRLPQDGAIKSKIGEKMLDLRVSSLPTNCGEKVVLRILDYSRSSQGLESLGFSQANYDKIMKMINIPNGIVLVTGATGSGKSTTVYSILQKLNTREVNIITVEDPVEMDVEGINQVQAQSEIGLDFASVLRSILRQDPDVIMIGEIRDSETAKIAVRASITGHKVLSTIHTNSALNTIERLTDMEVERYLIGTSLNGAISQKLARKLCPHCKKERPTTDYEKNIFRRVLHKNLDKIYDVNEAGCDQCFKGYKNRIAIAEVLLITDDVRTAITNNAPKSEMRKLVYGKNNTHTILEDGLEKVALGETTFDEIIKLADLENDLAIHSANDKDAGIKESDYENMPNFELTTQIPNVTNSNTTTSNVAANQSQNAQPQPQIVQSQENNDKIDDIFE